MQDILQMIQNYYNIPTFQTGFKVFTILSQAYSVWLPLCSNQNNEWILSWGKTTLDMLVAPLPLIFGENCAGSFCRSMCSNNRSNTFSGYTIPNAQRTIFRSSHIQAPSTRVAYLAATSVGKASGVKLSLWWEYNQSNPMLVNQKEREKLPG